VFKYRPVISLLTQFYKAIHIFQTYFYHLNTHLLMIYSQASKFLIYYKHIQLESILSLETWYLPPNGNMQIQANIHMKLKTGQWLTSKYEQTLVHDVGRMCLGAHICSWTLHENFFGIHIHTKLWSFVFIFQCQQHLA